MYGSPHSCMHHVNCTTAVRPARGSAFDMGACGGVRGCHTQPCHLEVNAGCGSASEMRGGGVVSLFSLWNVVVPFCAS